MLLAEPVSSAASNQLDQALSILPSDNFTEEEVREIVALGFTREQVS